MRIVVQKAKVWKHEAQKIASQELAEHINENM
jgi:hypothetical protein